MATHRHATLALAAILAVSLTSLAGALRAQDVTIVKQGSFAGASGHATSGSAAIVERDGRYFVSLGSDFVFDGAPDPKVALGADGYHSSTILGELTSDSGAQSYAIPEQFDPADYNEIWIWCEQFDVPLGQAALE